LYLHIAVLVAASLVGAEPDYSASYDEFLAKFGKGYADSLEYVSVHRLSLRGQR
jgi:hypothetical protein